LTVLIDRYISAPMSRADSGPSQRAQDGQLAVGQRLVEVAVGHGPLGGCLPDPRLQQVELLQGRRPRAARLGRLPRPRQAEPGS
jgi:hypothetical protein